MPAADRAEAYAVRPGTRARAAAAVAPARTARRLTPFGDEPKGEFMTASKC